MVGLGRNELVDQIPFRPHHLHPIVPSLAGEHRRLHELTDGPLHTARRQCTGLESGNGRFQGARRHAKRRVGIPTGMQDLHHNFASLLVHRMGHLLVRPCMP